VPDDSARAILSEREYELYTRMSRPERQHHLRVLRDLQNDHPALRKAALLHDVGKTRYRFSLPERILVVLVKAFLPGAFVKWSAASPDSWKRPFVISEHHPQWGADMAEAVGCDALTVELIRRHQSIIPHPPQSKADELLIALQNADNRS
jgi:putative nucleotidyltransferase with HDIG domain